LEKHSEEQLAERKVWEKSFFEKFGISSKTTGSKHGKVLWWGSATAWTDQIATTDADSGSIKLSHKDLMVTDWDGPLPSVACVTPIIGNRETKARIQHFINNFMLQNFKGPKHLILVFEHTDHRAAKLVKKYADGINIRGVAARDEEKAFPSTTALRYAAWCASQSGADIIARWDFDMYHHPDRLRMQVHAMALSSRPVSIVRQPGDNKMPLLPENIGSDASIVGETRWMRLNWHPLLGSDEAIPDLVLETRHVVEVESDLIHSLKKLAEDQPTHEHPWLAACRAAATQQAKDQDASVAKIGSKISEQLGVEVGHMYQALVVRRDEVVDKLASLCRDVSVFGDEDPVGQVHAGGQIVQMASAWNKINEHFQALSALFDSPA